MASLSSIYQRLMRLKEKRSRLDRHIQNLERKLQGKKYRWGSCSGNHNRTAKPYRGNKDYLGGKSR